MKTYWGSESTVPLIIDLSLDEISGQPHALAFFFPGKIPDAHWGGVWVGLEAGMDVVEEAKIYCVCQVPRHDVSGLQSLAQSTQ